LKERKLHHIAKFGTRLAAASLAISSCSRGDVPIPVTPELHPTEPHTTVPTEISVPTPLPEPSFAEFGPEATPDTVLVSYPGNLSSVEIRSLMTAAGGSLPEGFTQDLEVLTLIETRRAWLRQAGFNVDNPDTSDFVEPAILTWGQGDAFRWDIVPKDSRGNLAGWLQIRDETIETGWRFAERPTWDPLFNPGQDSFQFALPSKLKPENSFEVILYGNEYKILVEVDSFDNPQRWLNVAAQEMQEVEGAVESLWDPDRIRWSKLVEGTYNGVTAQLSIEVDFSIYERSVNALVGFEEAGGTWADVGNTTAAFVSMLPRSGNGNRLVEVNMDLKEDGTYLPVDFDPRRRSPNTKVEFDPKVPIRFVYVDGDGGLRGRVFPLKNPYFSRGWGVDSETRGLVIFMGRTTGERTPYMEGIYGTDILSRIAEIAGVYDGGEVIDEPRFDELYSLWYGDDETYTIFGLFSSSR